MKRKIHIKVNGTDYTFEVFPWQTLLEVLRENLRLVRTKEGCSVGECGSCAMVVNNKVVNSCLLLAVDADGAEIITAEGIVKGFELHPFHDFFLDQKSQRFSSEIIEKGGKVQKRIFTFCHVCPGHCSIEVVVEDGKIVDILPDKESGFPNELCPVKKGRFTIPEVLYHPERLKHPLKRVGSKGEGKWERISWEEALNTIAERLLSLKERYGPECVAFCLGEPKGLEFAFAQRLASAFGTPNVVTPGWCCGVPQGMAAAVTFGRSCVPDEEYLPRLLVIWGCNNNHTSGGMRRETTEKVIESGGKLIVVDPRKTDLAAIADLWVRPRPASDGALAMGLLKVIVEEELYEKDIVENWCIGFEELKDELRKFTLKEVSEVTWVEEKRIKEFARLYSQIKPASIQWGNALDLNPKAFATDRAIAILRAITGNVNIPGGDIFLTPPPYYRPGRFFLLKEFPREKERTVASDFALAVKSAFIPPHRFVDAVLTGKPYPIRAAIFILTNPMVSYPDSQKTYEALLKLDFMVVSEIFMTPTALLADIVLPAAWGMEREEIGYWPGWYEEVRAYPKIIDPPGEAMPDTKWMNELAKRLGLRKYFWENDEEALDEWLKPAGITYEEFKRIRVLRPKREYKMHDYKTPSGKIEIYSETAKNLGYNPIPRWEEVKDLLDPSPEYPLLMTNAKEDGYMLGAYKHVPSLRKMRPEPLVEMHPETAEKFGLEEGKMVWIETEKGRRIMQRLALNDSLDPRVVVTYFGWWYPEEKMEGMGWKKSNINVLTKTEGPYDRGVGTVYLRGIPCKVYLAE